MAGFRTEVILRINYASLDRILRQPDGLVGRYLVRLGHKVVEQAKSNAPVRSGALRRSISITTVKRIPQGTEVRVSANIEYALPVHQGAKPHVIEARNAPMLRFPSRAGMIVYTPRVNHPGNAPNPFLWNALKAVVN